MPDDLGKIVLLLKHWVDDLHLDLILTIGETCLSPRDLTPQATDKVIDYQVPGMADAMCAASYIKTPHAMIFRAVACVAARPGQIAGEYERLRSQLTELGGCRFLIDFSSF